MENIAPTMKSNFFIGKKMEVFGKLLQKVGQMQDNCWIYIKMK